MAKQNRYVMTFVDVLAPSGILRPKRRGIYPGEIECIDRVFELMQLLNAKNLTLDDVHRLLSIQQQVTDALSLPLEPLTPSKQQEFEQIHDD